MDTLKAFYPLLITALLITFSFGMKGSEPISWGDVQSLGLGRVYAPLSSYVNPAALSLSEKRMLTCAYENRFLVKELSTLTASYQQPTRMVDFAVLVNYFGTDVYHEIRCGLSVSKLLKTGLALGVRVYYYGMQYTVNEVDDRGVSVVTGDVGLQYEPVDNFRIGFLIQNPFRVSYQQGEAEYDLPVCMEVGVDYRFSEEASALLSVEKDTRYPICFKAGLRYDIEQFLQLRIGLLSSPFMPTAGVGFCFDVFKVDVAFSYHSSLGISPAIGICLNF